ncbi:hypothetical protein ACFWGP_05555 [Agromyces sp. NPDC127015]|uniref:hypothetical protein n=1 Tax=Agromyces sp. NPDC127015 TaxID=3347108 RepID=UPI003661EA4C
MTTPTTIETADPRLLSSAFSGLRAVQQLAWAGSEAKGFHEAGDRLRLALAAAETAEELRLAERALQDHWANRLMLIVGEAVEAHEELRSGRAVDETYYPTQTKVYVAPVGTPPEQMTGGSPIGSLVDDRRHKPEGVPSELADIVIRAFDAAGEAGIDLASIIEEKLRYNAGRPVLHGRQF